MSQNSARYPFHRCLSPRQCHRRNDIGITAGTACEGIHCTVTDKNIVETVPGAVDGNGPYTNNR